MVDLLRQGLQWLGNMRAQYLSHPVTYCRGERSVELAATVGSTTFEIDDGYGMLVKFQLRDFLIAAADLVIDGELVEPRSGDRITDGGKVYEVMAPGKEDVCCPSDPYGMTWRIHTKEVAV